jgi:hypothetical protein
MDHSLRKKIDMIHDIARWFQPVTPRWGRLEEPQIGRENKFILRWKKPHDDPLRFADRDDLAIQLLPVEQVLLMIERRQVDDEAFAENSFGMVEMESFVHKRLQALIDATRL